MAVVKYIGNPRSVSLSGYRFDKTDRRPKLVDDKFVVWLKGPGKENAKYFEVLVEKGGPDGETTKAASKGKEVDPNTGGTVTINLGGKVDENDKPDFPTNGFTTREAAISFAVDELGLDIEKDKEVAARYSKDLAVATLNAHALEDYRDKFGDTDVDLDEDDVTEEPNDGIGSIDTAAGSFKEDEGVKI